MTTTTRALMTTSNAALYAGIAARTPAVAIEDDTERRIDRLQRIEQAAGEDYVMLCYDIPTTKNAICPNPSRRLWRHGFRINFSCWVLPTAQLETADLKDLMTHWRTNGIRTHLIAYAESQRAKVREIARQQLSEEIVRAHTSLIERIDAADQALKALEADATKSEHEIGLACEARVKRVKKAIREAGECLNAAIACAQLFDESEHVAVLLAALRHAIASQRATLRGQPELFAA